MTDEIRHIPLERGIVKVALMRGDEELSRALVVPMLMQVGKVRVRMDGIGDVATPEPHRYKGYARRVLESAVQYMTSGDAVLSTLYGIPAFYPKYGFATLGPEPVIRLRSLDENLGIASDLNIRAAEPGDLPALQRLYREETARDIGALVRDDAWWTWEVLERALQPGANEVRVVTRDRAVVGYAWKTSECWWLRQWSRNDQESMKIGEAFATDPDAADAVLAACRMWSTETGGAPIDLAIPATSRVGATARFQNVTITERFNESAEFMGRSSGLAALLRALNPELDARWSLVSASLPPFSLTILTELERATITGSEQGITVTTGRSGEHEVEIDPGNMARLALGSFNPHVLLERMQVPVAARPALAALFPQRFPYIYPVDRF